MEIQRGKLGQEPELDMVFGMVAHFQGMDLPAEKPQAAELMPGYFPGTCLLRRTSLEKAGLFAETWQVGEFIDWYLRAREAGLKDALLPVLMLWRRVHDSNLGVVLRQQKQDFVRILKAGMDRKRRAGKEC